MDIFGSFSTLSCNELIKVVVFLILVLEKYYVFNRSS